MRRAALLSAIAIIAIGVVAEAFPGAAAEERFKGQCEDLFVPGYPDAGTKGTPTDDLDLIPAEIFEKAIADCDKRANRLIMKDERARLALTRESALQGRRDMLPDLIAAADKGVAEASYVIAYLYMISPPISPASPAYAELPRSLAEAHLRKAADAGLPVAMYQLGRSLASGILTARDEKEARSWQAKLEELSRSAGNTRYLAEARLELAAMAVWREDGPAEDRGRLEELARSIEDNPATRPYAQWIRIRGQRFGIGWPKDEAAARALAETVLSTGKVPIIAGEYAQMLAASADPADRLKLAELLEQAEPSNSILFGQTIGKMLYEGKPAGRDRKRGMEILGAPAWTGHADAVAFARMAVLSGVRVSVPRHIRSRLYEAVDLGLPGADAALFDLLTSSDSDFYSSTEAVEIAAMLNGRSEAMRLRLLALVAEKGPLPQYAPFDTMETALVALEGLVSAGVPEALRAKAMALRAGTLYPQDDVAATEYLIKAAEGGDVPAMLLLSDAYGRGTGIAESADEELRWIKSAMRAGSAEAEEDFVSVFPFRSRYKDYSVHDAVVLGMAQHADEQGSSSILPRYTGVFSSIETDRLGVDYVITALMNGFRASLSARRDETIVAIFKEVPKELTLKVEQILQAEGFLSAKPNGFMRPQTRKALMQWARAKGLPDMEGDSPPVSARADHRLAGVPLIPAERLQALRLDALERIRSAKNKEARAAATDVLQMLAQYGDVPSRLEIMRAYAGSNDLQPSVVLGLVMLYGLDALASELPPEEKVDIDFTFAATNVVRVGQGGTAADVILITLRDDPRLQDFAAFDKIADRFIFIGGLCDALAERAQANAIPGVEADACSGTSRRAMLAWAKAKGPDGSEAAIRRQAADYLQKLP